MVETALEEIRQAEHEADRILDDANRKKASLTKDARVKSAEFLKEGDEELARRQAQLLQRQKEKLLAIREKILADGEEKVKALRRSGEKKLDTVVDSVLDAFEKEILRG